MLEENLVDFNPFRGILSVTLEHDRSNIPVETTVHTSAMPKKIYWFQTKSTGQNFEIYWSDLSDLSHVW